METVTATANGNEMLFPLGLFNLYSDFYKNSPAEMRKFCFEYSLDGTPYNFEDFIRVCLVTTTKPKQALSEIENGEICKYLCMVNYAEMVGVRGNRPLERIVNALRHSVNVRARVINGLLAHNLSEVALSARELRLEGLIANRRPPLKCPHGCAKVSGVCPEAGAVHTYEEIGTMYVDSVIRSNATKLKIPGIGPEGLAVIESLLGIEVSAPLRRVFKFGLGIILVDQYEATLGIAWPAAE